MKQGISKHAAMVKSIRKALTMCLKLERQDDTLPLDITERVRQGGAVLTMDGHVVAKGSTKYIGSTDNSPLVVASGAYIALLDAYGSEVDMHSCILV